MIKIGGLQRITLIDYPGHLACTVFLAGCNFRCLHCQNSSISQVPRDMDVSNSGVYRHPKTIAASAVENDCRSISYTYVEPTIFFEYAYDCSVAGIDRGLKNIFVSNGYMSESTTVILAKVLAATNIDLKSFSDSFYKKVCGARLAPVLDSIARFKELGVWVEVTTLIIPGMNDSEQELTEIASFLAGIDRKMPWHVTGFYPSHKMLHVPPTGGEILVRAREIGFAQGLEYVYTGNRPEVAGENTACPSCKKTVIERHGFQVRANRLQDGRCPHCGSVIPGVWE